ncbi:MAG: metallophosphoesterase [Archaeoglobales archaeon]|nr:metallophosphoesterase [Archaeoglobales archaeon]
MRFVVVSDSHDNIFAIRELLEYLKNEIFDFVVHAGDIVSPFALQEFKKLNKKLYVAFGNNDGERKMLTKICEDYGWSIGDIVEFPGGIVYHGTDQSVLNILCRIGIFVICGHTHKAKIEKRENCTVINPGELCGYLTGRKTFAIVEEGEVSLLDL